ncbi:MAG TPA: alanine--glyoxylate aminotransferase family protein [Gemmatimonadaceae bacterium]|nr:alanine--glyoxylate aminotransferase family protein [Gemmatimonadaceae bacterium]
MPDTPFGTFFVPGPTEIRPEILEQLTRPMMSHRNKAFEAMFARIEAGLRDVFLTARPVYVGATSATGFMEMAVRNTPEGEILCLVNGGFSERFAVVAESCNRLVERIVVPWGQTFDLNVVEEKLATRRFVAVAVAHSETSTGVLTDVRAIAEVAHRYGTIALVDSVSGAGGAELTVDGWGLDFVFTGSQKAFALPAGLAFAVASAEFVERAKKVLDRGFYFDVVQYDKYAEKNQTPSTPATSLLYALEAQMGDMGREGIEQRWERHLAMRDATIDWVESVAKRRGIDIGVVAPEGSRSPTVTVISLPKGMAPREVLDAVQVRGYTLGSGYGQLRETTVRIGHMGDHTLEGLRRCLHACETAIAELAERRRLTRA